MNTSFLLAVVTALGAGILLNLTPCVLPAIPIKVRTILHAAGGSLRSRWIAAVLFATGSVLFFAVLGMATALLGLQWGVLFQSRVFTIFLVAVMALLAVANFLDKGLPVPRFAASMRGSHFLEPFLSGLLGALLSTPCTGPFLGGLLAFAVTQPPTNVVIIFIAIGVGLALPYLILIARPGLLARFPRSGAWTDIVRKSFGWILLGAALFFSQSLVPSPWILPLWLAFALALLGWCVIEFRRTHQIATRIAISLVGGVVAVAAVLGAGFVPVSANRLEWHTLAPADAGRLAALGRPVLLEFTADWCINCKVLEKTVYDSASVVHAVNAYHMVALRVDLTHSQPVLERLLVSYGGVGLPFAVVLDANGGVVQRFSGLFTSQSLIDAVNKLSRKTG
ncbi:MAG: thiol:disulfide interchange protein [Burkholderiaceae bacterium]|nr:MAG: thiol:disulfide interchange protein [Burkholderiaceae bacterium]